MEAAWKSFPVGGLLIVLFMLQHAVESVVASEWPLGPTDEYTMAWINVTYIDPVNGKLHTENTEVGKYGMGIVKVSPAAGVVVHVRSRRSPNGTINHYGCDPLTDPIPEGPWIALIKRGQCNFDKKLENAQARNAVAMVVYDVEETETLQKMGLTNCRNCTIPGIFTFKRIGEEIANITDSGTRVDMYITVGDTCTRPYSGINRTSVLFVSISFIVLMIISLAWLVFYYVQRFRYLHAKDRLAQRLCNAAKKALAKIPTRNIKLTDKELNGEAECCAVCIEFYSSGDVLRTLPCRHEFHKGCVDPWLLEHRTCPMCKMDILKYYGFIFTGSQESILHLDMEDGNINSSESRETDSPGHESHNQTHHVRYAEQANQVTDNPHSSSTSSFPSQQLDGSIRKPSLISLTVVAAPRGQLASRTTNNGANLTMSSENCSLKDSNSVSQTCSPNGKPSSLPEYQHPMCYVHGDGDSQHSHEDSLSEVNGVSASHQPLIHREGSTNRSHSKLDKKYEQSVDVVSPAAESQSHNEDLNKSKSTLELSRVESPDNEAVPYPKSNVGGAEQI